MNLRSSVAKLLFYGDMSRRDLHGTARRASSDSLPDLLVNEVCHGIDGRLHEGDRTTHEDAAAQDIAHRKRDGEVHDGETGGLGHGVVSGCVSTLYLLCIN